MKNEILIIPDVHGRDFWRKPIAFDQFEHIVFLGDYLDPYSFEDISDETALLGFSDIVRIKLEFPEKITLLIGNHDAHYWWKQGQGCRYSRHFDHTLHALFMYYKDIFQLVGTKEIAGKTYIFSHAGIMPEWLHDNRIDDVELLDINKLLDKDEVGILYQMSRYRGGYDPYPSPIWADIHDFQDTKGFPNTYQIFGHTQSDVPSIMKDWACLDCRKPFVLNIETGELREWDFNKVTLLK